MNIKKIIAYYLAVVFFFIVFAFANTASASTTYEIAAGLSENIIDFPVVGSGATSTPSYHFWYNLPVGTVFDRIQISVPSSQGAYTKSLSTAYGTIVVGDEPWNCMGSDCVNSSYTQTAELYQSGSTARTGSLEYRFTSTTTITVPNNVFTLLFDPNPTYTDFTFNGTPNQENSAGTNGYAYTTTFSVPVLKFCNGACDNNTFTPLPNVTATPWVRMISPLTGSTVQSGTTVPLVFQANTGTTTADNVIVRFSSSLQTFIPYEVELSQTGINSFSYDLNLPSFDDTIQIEAQMYSGTTSIVVSPTYTINVSSNPLDSVDNGFSCDVSIWEPSSFFTCAGSFIAYLFIPPTDTPALVWYSMGTEAVDTESIFTEAYNQALTALGTTPTSSVTALDMTIDITTPASTTISLPIISMGAFEDKAPDAVDFFRTLALGALVLFALQNYLKQVNEALVIITYKGLS